METLTLADKFKQFLNDPEFPLAVKKLHARSMLRQYEHVEPRTRDVRRLLGLLYAFLGHSEPVLDWRFYGF